MQSEEGGGRREESRTGLEGLECSSFTYGSIILIRGNHFSSGEENPDFISSFFFLSEWIFRAGAQPLQRSTEAHTDPGCEAAGSATNTGEHSLTQTHEARQFVQRKKKKTKSGVMNLDGMFKKPLLGKKKKRGGGGISFSSDFNNKSKYAKAISEFPWRDDDIQQFHL